MEKRAIFYSEYFKKKLINPNREKQFKFEADNQQGVE